jgi:hypothetical protein
LIVRDKVVLVLGRNFEINLRIVRIFQIDRDLHGSQSIEDSQELLDLGGDLLLRSITQMPVPRRYLNLHC